MGKLRYLKVKKADVSNTHGTGCSFSASIVHLLQEINLFVKV